MSTNLDDVLKERGGTYGPFKGHAGVAQKIKEVIRHNKGPGLCDLNSADYAVVMEALDMIAHKIGRIVNGDPLHEDSWVDIAGYARLVPIHTNKEEKND